MKIIAKGAYCFGPGVKRDGTVEKFETKPGLIMEMPDKFANDDLFKDCVKYGLISVITGASAPVFNEPESDNVPSAQDELNEFVANVRSLGHDELIEMAEDAGIELTGDEKDKEVRKALANAKKKELGL